jgi:hypothetical protein
MMTSLDPAKLLSYGAIGLGFLLAFLAYLLLSHEQKVPKPRQAIIRAIYSFMLFSFVLAMLGFVTELMKNRQSTETPLPNTTFTQLTPILRSPPTRSEHRTYPRDVEAVWEAVADAVAYKVETEVQVELTGENRYEWVALVTQHASSNHCQMHFGADGWARWRVSAINSGGQESQASAWWTLHCET